MLPMLVIGQSILFTASVILSVPLHSQGLTKSVNPANSFFSSLIELFICASSVEYPAFKTRCDILTLAMHYAVNRLSLSVPYEHMYLHMFLKFCMPPPMVFEILR